MARVWSVVRVASPLVLIFLLFEVAATLNKEVTALIQSSNAWSESRQLLSSLFGLTLIGLPLMLAEGVWPTSKLPKNYLVGLKFWAAYFLFNCFWATVAGVIIGRLGVTPLLQWSVAKDASGVVGTLSAAAAVVAWVFVYDFFYYWFHRAQHGFGFLWRFHKVHHSITELNCINSYHHVLEEVFRFPLIIIPLMFLIKIDTPQVLFLSAFTAAWGQYVHSDTALHLGRLNRLFADNSYHRVHHSMVERDFNRNFAAFFPVFDFVFGTQRQPKVGEFAPAGLADTPPALTVLDYISMPFRSTRGARDRERLIKSVGLP